MPKLEMKLLCASKDYKGFVAEHVWMCWGV